MACEKSMATKGAFKEEFFFWGKDTLLSEEGAGSWPKSCRTAVSAFATFACLALAPTICARAGNKRSPADVFKAAATSTSALGTPFASL